MVFSSLLLLGILGATLAYLFVSKIVNYLRRCYSYSQIGGPKCHWLTGNIDILKTDEKSILDSLKRMKNFPKMERIWVACSGSISAYYPSLCGAILDTKPSIPKVALQRQFARPWLGDSLVISEGKKWKRNRRLLTPAFHFEILKNYLLIFNATTKVMLEKWKNSDGFIEASKPLTSMTLDSILQCAMSYHSDCQNDGKLNAYVTATHEILDTFLVRYFNPFYWSDFIFNLSSPGRKFKKAVAIAHKHTTEVIKARRKHLSNISDEDRSKETKRKLDFLDIVLLAKDSDGVGLSDEEIRDEVSTFLFAGHDTSSSVLTWAMYNLSIYQEEQNKCREEVLEILGNQDTVEWEDVSKFKYLTMFIKESMRLQTPVPIISRELADPLIMKKDFKDDQYNTSNEPRKNCSQTLPAGTVVDINIFNTHRNPNIWDEPNKFDPTRFTTENIAKRPTYSYIPFSAGPRNCIGQNFAMIEIKVVLALILKTFKISLDSNYPKPEMLLKDVLKCANGMHLKLEKI